MKRDWLRRLGRGERIQTLCEEAGINRAAFDGWWQEECRSRLPRLTEKVRVDGLTDSVEITRDARGVPHIDAISDHDLFLGLGYAVAQDRLFQLDFLRRKANGRLAEILGKEAIESDLLYRTLDLPGLAFREWQSLPSYEKTLLEAYSQGINSYLKEIQDRVPIEFDLLDYRPEVWRPTDSLAIIGEFRWYLTGRFPVIAIPEIIKRAVGDGPLYRDFILGEADDESILFPGDYAPKPKWVGDAGGTMGGEADGGSNNWAISGSKTESGSPVVASDPHIPFYAVSIWHEVHLRSDTYNVAGVALAGMPAVMIGRNTRLAWGITNNICSLRDLYQEKTDPSHPGCFLYDGKWEPASTRTVEIAVREGEAVRKTITSSRNGPIVDEVVPAAVKPLGPISVRWQGFEPCGWLSAMLAMNRARSVDEFREAGRSWCVPTFNLVIADVDGNIAMQTVGKIPLRKIPERGFRPGWDPAHQWQGHIPYRDNPHVENPSRGFVHTANNRIAPPDFPYPMAGCWAAGYRAGRIRRSIHEAESWTGEKSRALQMDVFSGRAEVGLSGLLAVLRASDRPRVREAVSFLERWQAEEKLQVRSDSVGACLFNVFFQNWCLEVTRERCAPEAASFAAAIAGGAAVRLLSGDPLGWFDRRRREDAILTALDHAFEFLDKNLGSSMSNWQWGKIHVLTQDHCLSSRGDLGGLMNKTGMPVPGDGVTVNAGTYDGRYRSFLGAGYRMVADLADPNAGFWSVEVAGVSGQPGSPHYDDQRATWAKGEGYYLPLVGDIPNITSRIRLE